MNFLDKCWFYVDENIDVNYTVIILTKGLGSKIIFESANHVFRRVNNSESISVNNIEVMIKLLDVNISDAYGKVTKKDVSLNGLILFLRNTRDVFFDQYDPNDKDVFNVYTIYKSICTNRDNTVSVVINSVYGFIGGNISMFRIDRLTSCIRNIVSGLRSMNRYLRALSFNKIICPETNYTDIAYLEDCNHEGTCIDFDIIRQDKFTSSVSLSKDEYMFTENDVISSVHYVFVIKVKCNITRISTNKAVKTNKCEIIIDELIKMLRSSLFKVGVVDVMNYITELRDKYRELELLLISKVEEWFPKRHTLGINLLDVSHESIGNFLLLCYNISCTIKEHLKT